jgi:O-antigen/teichoic acid export membrane protein
VAKSVRSAPRKLILKSIGWATADAIGRVVLLATATIILSRLVDVEGFGISAIVLAIAAAAGFLVGTPFEEALVQRRVLRTIDLRSAFTMSMLLGAVLVLVSILAAPWIARIYDTPEMTWILPVVMVSILFNGHGDLATALARRRRRFEDIAAASLISHGVGVVVTIALAFAGFGVWALIALRLVVVFVSFFKPCSAIR